MQEKQGYKIVDIKWDTDGDKALFDSLPQEIILPEQFCEGRIRYQLDPLGGYGSELIDTFDSKSFTAEILTLKTAPVIRNNVVCYEEETGYPDDIPMYIPMK